MRLCIRDRDLVLGERTLVMGILNVTPDSFSDGGRFASTDAALRRAEVLCEAGVDLIDVGGESTRPGSAIVLAEEELRRVAPVVLALRRRFDVFVSIDTYKARVAAAALDAGADLVNDISALRLDAELGPLVARRGVAVVLMHSRGLAGELHASPRYDEGVVPAVIAELRAAVERARALGIASERIAVDPGLGFSKDAAQSTELLARLAELAVLGRPLLVGPSRKSFLGQITGRSVDAREDATAASVVAAILGGAAIVRVHEPAAVRDAVLVADALRRHRRGGGEGAP